MPQTVTMCLTGARSGTKLLSKLFAMCTNAHAEHEAEPRFETVPYIRRVTNGGAMQFTCQQKLPAILATSQPHYIETSHLFAKGYFDAFVSELPKHNLQLRLISLARSPRRAAKSLWRLGSRPGILRPTGEFSLSPDYPDVLPLYNWKRFNDYQLCYWLCLEVERRKMLYEAAARRHGIPVYRSAIETLQRFEHFVELCASLGMDLPADAATRHRTLLAKKINEKKRHAHKLYLTPLYFQERQVWDNIPDQDRTNLQNYLFNNRL